VASGPRRRTTHPDGVNSDHGCGDADPTHPTIAMAGIPEAEDVRGSGSAGGSGQARDEEFHGGWPGAGDHETAVFAGDAAQTSRDQTGTIMTLCFASCSYEKRPIWRSTPGRAKEDERLEPLA